MALRNIEEMTKEEIIANNELYELKPGDIVDTPHGYDFEICAIFDSIRDAADAGFVLDMHYKNPLGYMVFGMGPSIFSEFQFAAVRPSTDVI